MQRLVGSIQYWALLLLCVMVVYSQWVFSNVNLFKMNISKRSNFQGAFGGISFTGLAEIAKRYDSSHDLMKGLGICSSIQRNDSIEYRYRCFQLSLNYNMMALKVMLVTMSPILPWHRDICDFDFGVLWFWRQYHWNLL